VPLHARVLERTIVRRRPAEDAARHREPMALEPRRGPRRLHDPPPGPVGVMPRPDRFLQPRPQHRLVLDAVRDALQPPVPPTQALLEEPDGGPRLSGLGERMRPGADQALAHPRVPLEEARDRVRVAVRPAPDHVDGAVDRLVVLTDGALFPVRVSPLVPHPRVDERRGVLQPVEPRRPPPLSRDPRIRRKRVQREHRRRPRQHLVGEETPAEIMDVVGVSIVRGTQADDGLKVPRASRRDLQPVEATPRDPDHAHRPRAPRLRGEPVDHAEPVLLLLWEVLVPQDSLRVARPPDVHSNVGVAVGREVSGDSRVARGHEVALSVGQVFEDGRDRLRVHVLREPDASGEPAVLEGDPGVVDHADVARPSRLVLRLPRHRLLLPAHGTPATSGRFESAGRG
jgi:hypothetical protein